MNLPKLKELYLMYINYSWIDNNKLQEFEITPDVPKFTACDVSLNSFACAPWSLPKICKIGTYLGTIPQCANWNIVYGNGFNGTITTNHRFFNFSNPKIPIFGTVKQKNLENVFYALLKDGAFLTTLTFGNFTTAQLRSVDQDFQGGYWLSGIFTSPRLSRGTFLAHINSGGNLVYTQEYTEPEKMIIYSKSRTVHCLDNLRNNTVSVVPIRVFNGLTTVTKP